MKEEMDSDLADKDLIPILEIEGNQTCNDCGKNDPRWCSVNNSVLICSSCARIHKKFNEKISKIKSLEVDEWTKDEILFLKLGGNEKFSNIIRSYNIPLTKDNLAYKYYTKAAQYFRDTLVAESKKENINNIVKPSLKEGIELLYKDEFSNLLNELNGGKSIENNEKSKINEKDNNNSINNTEVTNINTNNNTNNSSWVSRMFNRFNPYANNQNNKNNQSNQNSQNNQNDQNNKPNTYRGTILNITCNMMYALNGIKEKAKEIDYKEKIKLAGEYVYDKGSKIHNSETFKGLYNVLSSGIGTIKEKTTNYFYGASKDQNSNQINNENNNISSQNNNDNNINDNKNIDSPNIQNNNENLDSNNSNKISESNFKSNYSSINNEGDTQYNNLINDLPDKNNDKNINADKNMNNIENNKDDTDKISDENVEVLDDGQNENNSNSLVMNNAPK